MRVSRHKVGGRELDVARNPQCTSDGSLDGHGPGTSTASSRYPAEQLLLDRLLLEELVLRRTGRPDDGERFRGTVEWEAKVAWRKSTRRTTPGRCSPSPVLVGGIIQPTFPPNIERHCLDSESYGGSERQLDGANIERARRPKPASYNKKVATFIGQRTCPRRRRPREANKSKIWRRTRPQVACPMPSNFMNQLIDVEK